ncbi:hypothetical protein Hanom_Chr07g00678201 [Helianthus anomalus]
MEPPKDELGTSTENTDPENCQICVPVPKMFGTVRYLKVKSGKIPVLYQTEKCRSRKHKKVGTEILSVPVIFGTSTKMLIP